MAKSPGKILLDQNIPAHPMGRPWANRIGQVLGILRYIELAILLVSDFPIQDHECKTRCGV